MAHGQALSSLLRQRWHLGLTPVNHTYLQGLECTFAQTSFSHRWAHGEFGHAIAAKRYVQGCQPMGKHLRSSSVIVWKYEVMTTTWWKFNDRYQADRRAMVRAWPSFATCVCRKLGIRAGCRARLEWWYCACWSISTGFRPITRICNGHRGKYIADGLMMGCVSVHSPRFAIQRTDADDRGCFHLTQHFMWLRHKPYCVGGKVSHCTVSF